MTRLVTHLRVRTRLILLSAAFIAWLCGSFIVTRVVGELISARFVAPLILVLGALAVVGGLLLFWNWADELDFVRLGYRIRRASSRAYPRWTLGPTHWVYEELDSEGRARALPFVRFILDKGYPAQSEVALPDEQTWDQRVPEWARGRRIEIVERVLSATGPSVTRMVKT